MLKNRVESEVRNMGMEVPFANDIKKGYAEANKKHIHSERCRALRESRRKKFDKVRILYWNLMFLLSSICIISVGKLVYEIIRILKMQ
jgi:hypothetical protein